MTTPRLRPELNATPCEEQGVKFFDVSDPRSGSRMRMYDFEWLLAAQMDGRRSLDEIAQWAKGSLHLDVSGANLAAYADRLRELGFFTLEPATDAAPMPVAVPAPAAPASRPPTIEEDISMEMTADEDVDDTQTIQQEALPPRMPEPAPAPRAPAPARADDTPREPTLQSHRDVQPVAATRTTTTSVEEAPARSSRGMMWLVLVLLAVGGVYAYVTMFGGAGAKVTTQLATTRNRIAFYDGSAKLGGGGTQALSFGEAGKVTDVVAVGTEVKAGTPVATLEGFAKVEKEITDVKDRLGFYQKQLDAATAKGDANAQKAAEAKVAEKKKALADLEGKAGKLRLVAPGPGTVSKVDVTAGGEAKPDAPAVEIGGGRPIAVFTMADAGALKAGDEATLQGPGNISAPAKIVKVAGGEVTVEPADNTLKAGDEVRLVKSKAPPAIAVPAAALVGADTVFVFAGGEVHAKKVVIADRTPTEVFVTAGINPGEQIVTSGAAGLKDGQKVTTGP